MVESHSISLVYIYFAFTDTYHRKCEMFMILALSLNLWINDENRVCVQLFLTLSLTRESAVAKLIEISQKAFLCLCILLSITAVVLCIDIGSWCRSDRMVMSKLADFRFWYVRQFYFQVMTRFHAPGYWIAP